MATSPSELTVLCTDLEDLGALYTRAIRLSTPFAKLVTYFANSRCVVLRLGHRRTDRCARHALRAWATMACDPMTSSLLPYAPERDVYRLLQVEPNASDQQIAVACRRLALAFHPDYNRSPRAHEEMQIVN